MTTEPFHHHQIVELLEYPGWKSTYHSAGRFEYTLPGAIRADGELRDRIRQLLAGMDLL